MWILQYAVYLRAYMATHPLNPFVSLSKRFLAAIFNLKCDLSEHVHLSYVGSQIYCMLKNQHQISTYK